MKTKILKKVLTIALFVSGIVSMSAQQTTGDAVKSANAIKVVDNKGTIKYFQSQNGITMITNSTKDKTTTTWQLGGVLTDDTYIDSNGKLFVLDKLKLETGAASSNATDSSVHGGTGTGWTLLVRDEKTGETKKLLAADLLSGIRVESTIAADGTGATQDIEITVTGLPVLSDTSTMAKLFVFRNGIKLRPTADFTTLANKVVLKHSTANLPVYAGDIIEIQYIK